MDLYTRTQRSPFKLLNNGGDVVKEVSVKELSSNEFEVQFIQDGGKLDRCGRAGDGMGTDKILEKKVTSWDYEAKSIRMDFLPGGFVGKEDKTQKKQPMGGCAGRFRDGNPLTFEGYYYRGTKRYTSKVEANSFEELMEPFANILVSHKVEVLEDVLSPTGEGIGRSAVCIPLENFADYDEFFKRVLEFQLRRLKSMPGWMFVEESENHLTMQTKSPPAFAGSGVIPVFVQKLEHDQEEGIITINILKISGEREVLVTIYFQFHRRPIVLESWLMVGDRRESGFGFAKFMVQNQLQDALFPPEKSASCGCAKRKGGM